MRRSSNHFDHNASLSRSSLVCHVLLYGLLAACFFGLPASASKLEQKDIQKSTFEAKHFFKALSAELYNKLGETNEAVESYYDLIVSSNDPAIAKRVTELATSTGQISKALKASKRWVELAPDDLESNQYLSLLLLRNGFYESSATQIDVIRTIIEESLDETLDHQKTSTQSEATFYSSQSLRFIGALLSAEAHHKKALTVFEMYLENHAHKSKNYSLYKKQERLIHAQLAMKAKAYSVVLSSLNGLKNLDAENHIDAVVLQAKALQKLGRYPQSIVLLESIQDHSHVDDSHRLELVRLLVLSKQKEKALPILDALVSKHPKNIELLKSYVALRIDQSQLRGIEQLIATLAADVNYVDEASYFSGEYAEKLGQREKALRHYSNVNEGSYLKNAHKKRIYLTKLIHGRSALKKLFFEQQQSALSIANQAYWIALEADELFESLQYTKAHELYNKATQLMPEKMKYRFKRGLANKRLGEFAKAETDFKYVLKKRSNDVNALSAFSHMLTVHTNRFNEAKMLIDKAFKLKPNDPMVLDSMGFLLYKTGDFLKAEPHLRKAYRLMKKPEIASHLIALLAKTNQLKEASLIYAEMRNTYPNSESLKGVSGILP